MKGIQFGNIHSWNNLGLILSKAEIPPAQPKTIYVDLPGADGSADLSEFSGRIKYYDRECNFVFTVLPQFNFEEVKRNVSKALNGLKTTIRLDKDTGFYWEGRCTVNEYAEDEGKNQIVITAVVRPYKYRDVKNIVFSKGTSVQRSVQIESDCPVTMTIKFNAATTIVIDGNSTNYSAGEYRFYDVKPGSFNFVSTSTGSFTITYQGRAL